MKTSKNFDKSIIRHARHVVNRVTPLATGLLGTVALLASVVSHTEATTIANWGFEGTTNGTNNFIAPNTTTTPAPNLGPDMVYNTGNQFATGGGGSTTQMYSSPAGNGSLHSFSANNWSVGAYFQFTVNTTGATNIMVSYDQTGSNTGPKDFYLQVSNSATGMFTNVGNSYAVNFATWNTTVANTVNDSHMFDFSSNGAFANTGLENNGLDYFRIVDLDTMPVGANSTFGSSGSDRVDNFVVTGIVVPEPSTILGGVLVMAAFGFWARRVSANGSKVNVDSMG